jgi:4-hydroxy-tetrahydrodipicolinate reductase
MQKKRVCAIGCLGKMGQVVCRAVLSSSDYELAAGVDLVRIGDDIGLAHQMGPIGVMVSDNLTQALADGNIDLAIDFSTPAAVVGNVAKCLQSGVPTLVGTTGISSEDVEKLRLLAEKVKVPVLIVPNFAIGALLMMEFATKAAAYLPHVEIIELHHPQKLDKPSGTARRTRENILEVLKKDADEPENVPIHSVRLPGLVAHQEVIFGGLGQCLTIRHDSFQRESFIPGIQMGMKQLFQVKGLKIGLEI